MRKEKESDRVVTFIFESLQPIKIIATKKAKKLLVKSKFKGILIKRTANGDGVVKNEFHF